ncbi:MAG: phosphate signaling complex protein PhoU [Steroidobacteraceae bacterium]
MEPLRPLCLDAPGPVPGEGHTARAVDQSLAGLRLHAVEMGGLVIDQVGKAVEALLGRDTALAETVLSREAIVNGYDARLDADSLTFIALQQPVANDLRMTRAVARAALELERAGDEAKKIARFAARIGASPGHDPVVAVARHLRHMASLSVSLLRDSVRALDESSPQRARAVLARDRELDAEFADAIRQLMSFVMEDRQFLSATVDTVFALKGLERIGDHAKNIAEQVIYMVEGVRA